MLSWHVEIIRYLGQSLRCEFLNDQYTCPFKGFRNPPCAISGSASQVYTHVRTAHHDTAQVRGFFNTSSRYLILS